MITWMEFTKYSLLLIGALLVTAILNGVMLRKGFKVNRTINILAETVTATALILVGGISVWTLQGIVFSFILLYAANEDYTKREADDYLWIMILLLSVPLVSKANIVSMLLGAGMLFVPALAIAMTKPGSLGGADIKIAAASGFFMGFTGGTIGYCIGLLFSILFNLIYNKIKNRNYKKSFPMIPFLAVGFAVGYFI